MKFYPLFVALSLAIVSGCTQAKMNFMGNEQSAPQNLTVIPEPIAQEVPEEPTPVTNVVLSQLGNILARTEMNVPVEFSGTLTTVGNTDRFVALDLNGAQTLQTPNGRLEIINKDGLKFRYLPNFNFRGEDSITVYLIQDLGRANTSASIRVQVDNALSHLKPALAVRGTGCIMCHGTIGSNVITDFGYGDSYFFGGSTLAPVDHTSIYSDESTDPAWKYVNQLGANVIVPKAPTTGLTKVPASSLASYLQGVISASPNALVKNTKVVEANSVYIGAPSAARIAQVSGLNVGVEVVKYLPDYGQTALVPALIRQKAAGVDFFTNDTTKPLICSGDLIVDGVLHLNRPVIQTQTGCRIYATKSVFITGPITYSGGDASKRNLQIVSSRSIVMGLGKNTCGAPGIGTNSFDFRLKQEDRRKFFFTRGEPEKTVQQKLDDIYNDANQIGVNTFLDAACEPTLGRKVPFERLILNAPIVFSRYQGGFRGAIVAEIALMSLENFIFEFDPVFSSETVLPLLSPSDYLNVQ